ncbi:putative Lipase B [Glarea lozoyensis 74030]|uniref:Putative Lipase B n=1 Tax=Glarea lozoyensis (strain ATCC 74030 / MF5533) TaxID=1104152 RepID=H0EP01_GLAL7|nr:putative Lipase B [Glarea lozoyensis 74030]
MVSNNKAASPNFYKIQTLLGNAPFSVPESQLLQAIYIPPEFTGQKQPIIFVPGTGTIGSTNFQPNIGKLLSQSTIGDPVYLQIPNNLLGDIQTSAEYVSYAIQYINQLTSKKPAVITWSQGSLVSQWAFKYWKTTRAMVTDLISISPDFDGTILALLLCPGFASGNAFACTEAVFQQVYNSNFITTLKSNNGDSAYVPTTTVYTATDEIVQPQIGNSASGFISDARGVGTSNTFLQGACLALPAGTLYGHAGVLINPTAYALVVDALTHDGPGDFNRVTASCVDVVAPGIGIGDVLATEALIPEAALNILSYLPKVAAEPAIRAYAGVYGQS